MPEIIHYNACPVCGSHQLQTVSRIKDFLISKEEFDVVECSDCHLRITQDVPNAEGIARYYDSESYISHSNTKKGLINKLYHQVRKITLEQKKRWVETWTGRRQGRLLDLGAGTGAFVAHMKANGWETTGLEPDPVARKVAGQDNGIVLNDMDLLPKLPAGNFHAITLWHVLEHVHDLNGYVKRISEMLANDGAVFIAVPNYQSADAQFFKEYWAAYDVPRHLYHFSAGSMKQLLEAHGLKLVARQPMRFDSYYVSLLSNRYKTGSNRFLHSFIKGFSSNRKAVKFGASSVVYVARK